MPHRLIVLTDPEFFEGEVKTLNQLFEAGLERLHIRKPQSTKNELECFVKEIDPKFRRKIIVHHHKDLVTELDLGGMHFSYPEIKNEERFINDSYSISCSLHHWNELKDVQDTIDYCFISPVFNSISKPGYEANGILKIVPSFAKNAYALGGITETNYKEVLDNGYSGIAVLGYLWNNRKEALHRFTALKQKVQACEN